MNTKPTFQLICLGVLVVVFILSSPLLIQLCNVFLPVIFINVFQVLAILTLTNENPTLYMIFNTGHVFSDVSLWVVTFNRGCQTDANLIIMTFVSLFRLGLLVDIGYQAYHRPPDIQAANQPANQPANQVDNPPEENDAQNRPIESIVQNA